MSDITAEDFGLQEEHAISPSIISYNIEYDYHHNYLPIYSDPKIEIEYVCLRCGAKYNFKGNLQKIHSTTCISCQNIIELKI